jgi:hypothetical protein
MNEREKWGWKIYGEIGIQAPENNFLRGIKIFTSPDNTSVKVRRGIKYRFFKWNCRDIYENKYTFMK